MNEIDFRELSILILSNFNILHEVMPDFISYGLTKNLTRMMKKNVDIQKIELVEESETHHAYGKQVRQQLSDADVRHTHDVLPNRWKVRR